MEINLQESLTILEMADYCYSEGELSKDAFNLAKRVLLEWQGEKMTDEYGNTIFFTEAEVKGKLFHTGYLLKKEE